MVRLFVGHDTGSECIHERELEGKVASDCDQDGEQDPNRAILKLIHAFESHGIPHMVIDQPPRTETRNNYSHRGGTSK